MRHLSEEDIIDVVMGETTDPAWERHLEACPDCRAEVDRIELGLSAARAVKPRVPLMPVPSISYEKYKRGTVKVRMAWIAAAAALLLSLSGLRIEVGGDGLAIQMGLPGLGTGAASSKLAELEDKYQTLHYAVAANEIRSNQLLASFQEEIEDRDDLGVNVSNKLSQFELQILDALGTMTEDDGKNSREQDLEKLLKGNRQ